MALHPGRASERDATRHVPRHRAVGKEWGTDLSLSPTQFLTGDRNPLHYDEITAEVEVLEARMSKGSGTDSSLPPTQSFVTRLRTTVRSADGTVALDGEALVWTEPV